ncbi:MAG: alpha-1,2-fucosyltransferase [Simkaniaceae bacterium]|nr:alpha-1,2-fucosyltransferase [Simkaniaceae bacterium]
MKSLFLLCTLLISIIKLGAQGYVSVELDGQFGNQLFRIAAAYTYSLDHQLPLTVPDLVHKKNLNIPLNATRLFLNKIDHYELPSPPNLHWKEPSFNYSKIPYASKIKLYGWLQSEKYFKHRRKEILDLFAAPPELNELILAKYPFLSSSALVVGVQIRDYRKEMPTEAYHPTVKRNYYEKAFSRFPDDAIFLISSNNNSFAKECTEGLKPNLIYLNENDYIEEFYTLVLCKSFIISNSSFGWWASWLSTAPNKIVIAPTPWFAPPYNNEVMMRDLLPPEYQIISH